MLFLQFSKHDSSFFNQVISYKGCRKENSILEKMCTFYQNIVSKNRNFSKLHYFKFRLNFLHALSTHNGYDIEAYCVQRAWRKFHRKKSYEFFKIGLLHKNGVTYEFHANLQVFKNSKNDQKPHKSQKHLTSCLTNI